jgi:hypothetical protein
MTLGQLSICQITNSQKVNGFGVQVFYRMGFGVLAPLAIHDNYLRKGVFK